MPNDQLIDQAQVMMGAAGYYSQAAQYYGDQAAAPLLPPTVPAYVKGDSAYEVAVKNGYSGSEEQWLASLTGADGGVAAEQILTCIPATANYQKASNMGISGVPVVGTLTVDIGGPQRIGDGVRTADCYFSADNGATAKALNAIAPGDKLYWNAAIAGFSLAADDICVLHYRTITT